MLFCNQVHKNWYHTIMYSMIIIYIFWDNINFSNLQYGFKCNVRILSLCCHAKLVLNDYRQVKACGIGRHFLSITHHTHCTRLIRSHQSCWHPTLDGMHYSYIIYVYISLIMNPGWFFQLAEVTWSCWPYCRDRIKLLLLLLYLGTRVTQTARTVLA